MKRTIFLVLGVLIFAQVWAGEPVDLLREKLFNAESGYVSVVAHRGDWRNSPENSMRAFERCIAMGVDIVEIDVRQTADGELVVIHDASVNRTTSGKGKVAEMTLAEVRDLRLRAGHGAVTQQQVPTLEEVLKLCKGKILINIDKGDKYFDQIHKMLVATGTINQVVIKGSKSHETVRSENSKVLEELIYMPIINLNAEDAERHLDEWLAAKPVAIECCISDYTPEVERLMKKFDGSKVKIWINTLWPSLCAGHDDDRAVEFDEADEAWGWVLDRGATLIQTDRPTELISYLKSKGRRE